MAIKEIGIKYKANWKVRLVTFLFTSITYGGIMALMTYYMDKDLFTWQYVLFNAFFFALFFTFVFPTIMIKMGKGWNKKSQPTLEHEEEIIAQGPANFKKKYEMVGGKLLITNLGLIFKSHKVNFQAGQHNIRFSDIRNIEPTHKFRWIKNQFIVHTRDKQYLFTVNDREEWIKEIEYHLRKSK